MSDEALESDEGIYDASFNSDKDVFIVFDRNFHAFLFRICFQSKNTPYGYLKNINSYFALNALKEFLN